ncbi:MAG: AAA family ATPase [Ardenticatenaceae bacterium]|nr:AAA family ATPase [Ardenticatenaceae bacterium]
MLLEQILTLSNGARFYRADLHNHTPADPGFHCLDFNLTTEDERRALAEAYVRYAREEQELDIIGITDHNDVSWIRYVQEAAAGTGLVVIPGVELGANEGKRQVHFLALFDPDTDPEKIDHFISSLGLLPHTRFDPQTRTPRLTQMSCRELTARIATGDDGLPGLPIAAHATRKNGLLHELEGEGRVLAYEDQHLLALEIPATRGELSRFVNRLVTGQADHYGNKSIACLNSSDGRGLGQTNEKGRLSVGERYTRIKLSHFSVNALRQAFIDFDSRIRLNGEHVQEKYPRLLGLAIERGFLSGRIDGQSEDAPKDPLLIHFNPNLNTIIGGRGTGKSSLLEAVRFVFDVPARTQATIKQHSSVVDVTLPKGAAVTAYYELADGTRYEIRRVRNETPQVIDVATGAVTNVHPTTLLPHGLPLEVYGQKEVYEIANDVNFQLNLLDTYISDQLRDVRRAEADLVRWLEANAQAILHLKDELAAGEQELAALPGLRLEIERLEKLDAIAQLSQMRELEEARLALQHLEELADERITQVERWFGNQTRLPLDDPHFPELTAALNEMDQHITQVLHQLRADLTASWTATTAARETWRAKYAEGEAAYRQLVAEFGDGLDLDRYFSIKEKEAGLVAMARIQDQKIAQLEQTVEERREKLAALHTLRSEKEFGLRLAKTSELNEALRGTVLVKLTPMGNREAYAEYLADLFKRTKSGITRKTVELITAAGHDAAHLAQAVRQEQEQDGESLLETVYGISPSYRKRLAALDEECLFELEIFRIPDLPDIRLKVGDAYRSLTPPPGEPGLSTGQKCTAILSLILVERNTPLIIDQPEDDLDNAFIFSEIVQTLRREKERRQFVIATHNANIPVSGDAELILLMKANEQCGWVEHAGSIDDPVIREPVENILEGGREAFLLRQVKYNI